MLYQTLYPLLFQFHPFPSSSSTTTPLHPSHLLLPPQQVEREMECVETALKTSLRKDIMTTTVKLIPQTFTDENGTTCDDFFVDDLLDFSHVEEPQDSENQHKEDKKEEEKNSLQKENQSHEISNPATSFSLKDDYGSLPTNDLNVPTDDVADLEWLSHFVEDSFSEFSSALPAVTLTENPKCVVALKPEPKPKPEQQNPVFSQPCLKFKTPIQIQTKARSKRTRTSIRVWPFGSPCFTESSTTTTTTTSSSSSSPTSPLLIYTNLPQSLDQFSSEAKPPPPPPTKKPKKGTSLNGVGSSAAVPAPRRCTHCGVQKTPQWRTGPLGAKTLCNACGVRFKSGRLLPEYRPACSPTFSSELHSNHHRKVLEMRRKKEVIDGVEIETGLSPASVVPSF